MVKKGTVYLIGAGPGDPGLMTIKGKEVLGSADVIVYDYLVNRRLLELARNEAETIYVGKKAGVKEMSQERINALLVEHAEKGRAVARLKGGDPFIFGRGGEEAEELARKGIPFEIVPGVTSASAVPAYAGIPLTHRDITSSFAVVTGHEDPSKAESSIPWRVLSKIGTVVFLMGVKKLGVNMRRLIDAGKPPATPAAVITWGTYPSQSTVTGTIENIAETVRKRKDITSPAIVVVGEVVALRDIMNWYESKPLFGKKVVVTRAEEQASTFTALLEGAGAHVVLFPAIKIEPPKSYKSLDSAIDKLHKYDWIVFTSVNGVKSFFDRMRARGKDLREMHRILIAAIGEVTASDIEKRGMNIELVPQDYRAEGLIKLFRKKKLQGAKILIPRAKEARDILPATLREMGADVQVATAYETKMPGKRRADRIRKMLSQGEIDVLTFTSSSTVRNFLSAVGGLDTAPAKPVIACIGPVTANTLKENGYRADIVPGEYTVNRLTEEIILYFNRPGNRK